MRSWLLRCALALLCCCGLVACTTGNGGGTGRASGPLAASPTAITSGMFALPAPSTLAVHLHATSKSVSYAATDLAKLGRDFDPALPHQRVVAGSQGALY